MKKIYFLFCALIAAMTSFAQTIPGGDMESWRSITTGGDSAEIVTAPNPWFGQDSLIIAIGQTVGPIASIPDYAWSHQLFREDTIVHSGAHAAKIITTYQDTILLAGSLSNAQADVHLSLSPPGITGITFFGGQTVTTRPTTVSAWVQYYPGKDSVTGAFGGPDTATLSVQAISAYSGTVSDTTILIPASSSWVQITANLAYTDTMSTADTLRITFSSSGGAAKSLDSSTLYVDDVTMTSIPEVSYVGVKNIVKSNAVKVYPNPATDAVYIDGPQNAGLSCSLLSVSGQLVATKALTGNDVLDVSELPAGLYIYIITDQSGNTVQKGKVTVVP